MDLELPGGVAIWRDPLIDGPAPMTVDYEQWLAFRSGGLVERTVLQTANRLGPCKVARLLGECLSAKLPFLSDGMAAAAAQEMTNCAIPLLRIDDPEALSHPCGKVDVEITEIGQSVLAGNADHIKLNGVNRWLGGVHLQGDEAQWRWDAENRRLLKMDGKSELTELRKAAGTRPEIRYVNFLFYQMSKTLPASVTLSEATALPEVIDMESNTPVSTDFQSVRQRLGQIAGSDGSISLTMCGKPYSVHITLPDEQTAMSG